MAVKLCFELTHNKIFLAHIYGHIPIGHNLVVSQSKEPKIMGQLTFLKKGPIFFLKAAGPESPHWGTMPQTPILWRSVRFISGARLMQTKLWIAVKGRKIF